MIQIPEDIVAAIEALEFQAFRAGQDDCAAETDVARSALEATILRHLSGALDRVERLKEVLKFYADEENYQANRALDPNSSWFEGNTRAHLVLARTEAEEERQNGA